jgi:hypothetical protein
MRLKRGDKGVVSLELVSCLCLLLRRLPTDENALVEGRFGGRPRGKASGDIDTKVGGQSTSSLSAGGQWIGSRCGEMSRRIGSELEWVEATSESEAPGELSGGWEAMPEKSRLDGVWERKRVNVHLRMTSL